MNGERLSGWRLGIAIATVSWLLAIVLWIAR